jgi:tetrapyrrole methylase family protein/MazG family protein
MNEPPPVRSGSTFGSFEALLDVVGRLRDPDGCPWDRVQTHASLRQYLLEECYEALDAIDSRNAAGLAEELGDLLVHIAFHADIARRGSEWTAEELISRTVTKLVRRHPHVFSDAPRLDTPGQVVGQWEALKRAERGDRGIAATVPKVLPALAQAAALQRKAEAAGVEWRRAADRRRRSGERRPNGRGSRDAAGSAPARQLADALSAPEGEMREAAAGEALLEIVAAIKAAGVDPETALRSANHRLRRRLESQSDEGSLRGA